MLVIKRWLNMVIDAFDAIFGDDPDEFINKPVRKSRRKYDKNPITKQHFDYIKQAFDHNEATSRRIRLTQEELADELNAVFGFNKSRGQYSKYWNGKVERESLPDDVVDF